MPSRRHATAAAFGFNAPKSRAPQAVLLAVPPDPRSASTTPACSTWCWRRGSSPTRARPATDRRADSAATRPRRRSCTPRSHATSSTGGRHDRPALPHPRTGPARHSTRACARGSPTRSGSSPGSGSSASTRARTPRPRSWSTAAPQHVPITYDRIAAGSRSDRDPGRGAARGGAGRLVDDRSPRAARPRGRAADRRRASARASARDAAGAVRRSGGRGRRTGRLPAPACSRGTPIWAEVPSPAADRWSSSELDYSASFEAGGTALRRAITPAATSTGSPSTAIRRAADHPAAAARRRAAQVIPGRLDYPGAPNPRWWQLEDHAVDIGGFAPDRSHFATMLLLDRGPRARRRLVHLPRAAAARSCESPQAASW